MERIGLGTISPRGAGAEALADLPEPLSAARPERAEAGCFIGRYLLGDHCVLGADKGRSSSQGASWKEVGGSS